MTYTNQALCAKQSGLNCHLKHTQFTWHSDHLEIMIKRVTRLVFLNILRKSYVQQKNLRLRLYRASERTINSVYPANLGSLMNKISMIIDGSYSRIAASQLIRISSSSHMVSTENDSSTMICTIYICLSHVC
jgi:hypothetical protein